MPPAVNWALLETANRGVVAIHVVSDFGAGHRRPHLPGRERDGVAAKVDPDRASGGGLGHTAVLLTACGETHVSAETGEAPG